MIAPRIPMTFAVLVAYCSLVAIPAPVAADETVVRVASGRQFAGAIDARTDAEKLWIRGTYGGLTVRRPIDWDRVVSARHAGEELSAEAFRAAALESNLESTAATTTAAAPSATPAATPAVPETVAPVVIRPERLPPRFPPRDGRVRSLQIDAWAANWDDDAEVDGLVLNVYPLSRGWRLTPVSGSLAVELFGERVQAAARRTAFPQIGRWSQAVHPADFGPAGAVYQLEFRHVHPEFELDLAAHGLLHVRLTAPGHGTFDASLAELRVRPYSGVRDRLQQRRGTRFFSEERTSR